MKKYTPGPWEVYHRRADVSRMETNEIHYGNDTECIAEYVANDNDARLIAAAPDLVEALEDAKMFIENGIELGYISMPTIKIDTAPKTLPHINAALKKAGVI